MSVESFATRLNKILDLRDIKPVELSRAVKIPEGAISCYRKGLYEPKQGRLEKMAKALNVSVTWLMGGDVPLSSYDDADNLPTNNEPLSLLQKQIESCTSNLNPQGQAMVLRFAQDLVASGAYKNNESEEDDRVTPWAASSGNIRGKRDADAAAAFKRMREAFKPYAEHPKDDKDTEE